MKIIYRNGFVDLGAPVYMSEQQKEKFEKFMKNTYSNVDVIYDKEEASRPGPHGGEQKKWTVDDIAVLLAPGTIEDKCRKLDRTDMSVIMRTGSIVPKIMKWLKDKGETNFPPSKKLIKEFMHKEGML